MDLQTIIASYAMQFVSITPVVVTIATGISMLMPTKLNTEKDTTLVKIGNALLGALNLVAGNILKNKNEK